MRMSFANLPDSGKDAGSTRGHTYQGLHISGVARAHLGDTYHIGQDDTLSRLPYAPEAPFNSYQRQHEPACLPETRVDILREICGWIDGEDEQCIFWLNGLAGTGKSTIARTVARKYYDQERLGASFFFSRGGGDISHAAKFVTSIAVQLAQNVPDLKRHVCDAIIERGDIATQSLRDQWQQLVLRPLLKLSENNGQAPYALVVDALDECDDDNNIQTIIHLLAEVRSLKKAQLRVFLTSRPEVPIRNSITHMPDTERRDFILHRIEQQVVHGDIRAYFKSSFKHIEEEQYLDAGWPGEELIQHLVLITGGLFIWAATACKFIKKGAFADDRLRILLEGNYSTEAPTEHPEKHLDELYTIVLRKSIRSGYSAKEKDEWYSILQHILGCVVVLFSSLSATSLQKLLNVPKQRFNHTLRDLHAILDIPKVDTYPLGLHHPSFRDFLLDKSRCGDANFWVNERQAHQLLAENCIKLMTGSLKQDICSVENPGILIADIEKSQVERSLPPELQYACLYWTQHIEKSAAQLEDNDQVHQFLQAHLLHWFEVLGWMGRVPEGVHAIASLGSLASSSTCPSLSSLIYDAKRFLLYNRTAIEHDPLQVYCGLIFAPITSIVRERFKCCIPRWIVRLPRVEEKWSAVLQTLEGHTERVNAVAFSPDGKTLASASFDRTARLWDARSGAVRQTLEGHTGKVSAVAFSPDGKTLASASSDQTVRLWDARSGAVQQTLEGHTKWVSAVVFSPDGKTLASASFDQTVRLWDARSGAVRQTLKGHTGEVNAVAFSPDGKALASASDDRMVRLWDARSGAVRQTLKGHTGEISTVAFSQDGKTLASASGDQTVRLWDARSGAVRQTLEGHTKWVNAVVFSPDGKTLASASFDRTVRLWDAMSGAVQQTLEGHTEEEVSAVVFSPDGKTLASASGDQTVRLWNVGSNAVRQTLEGHTKWVSAVVFSPDGKTLASASVDKTVRLWDARSGTVRQTLEGHTEGVRAVAFSPDGKTLASASVDKTVRLWDARSGAVRQTLEGHTEGVRAVAFSPDSKTLASASVDKTVRLWDVGSGAVQQTLKGHTKWVSAVAFSPDGKTLATTSADRTVRLWDVGSGAVRQTLEGRTKWASAVAFSLDGKTLASASFDRTVRLWDVGSGAVQQTFHTAASVTTMSFSEDGNLLHTNRGSLPISPIPPTVNTSANIVQPLSSVFVQNEWVCYGTRRILWLPPEYRSLQVDVHRGVVGFGYMSRRVVMIEFDL